MSSTIDDKAYYQSLEDRGHLQRELDEAKKEIARLQQREQEVRERVVGRFMAIVKGIKGPNVPRVDLYEAMLVAGREILRRDSEQEGEQPK